jgi:hypothetical protein
MKLFETLRGRDINSVPPEVMALQQNITISDPKINRPMIGNTSMTSDNVLNKNNNNNINNSNEQCGDGCSRNGFVQSTVGGSRNPKCSKCRNHGVHVPVKSKPYICFLFTEFQLQFMSFP